MEGKIILFCGVLFVLVFLFLLMRIVSELKKIRKVLEVRPASVSEAILSGVEEKEKRQDRGYEQRVGVFNMLREMSRGR